MDNEHLKHIKLAGGIGNQLFQYAFGLYLKNKYRCNVSYFTESGISNNEMAINKLIDNIRFSHKDELKTYGYFFDNRFAYRFCRKALLILPFLSKRILVENGSNYNSGNLKNVNLFDGYWQSYRYLEEIDLKPCFDNIKTYDLSNINIEDMISRESVFIHIRRGDYLKGNNKKIFAPCDVSYFHKAVETIKNRLADPHFFVFSNDIDWVKKSFVLSNDSVTYVENKGDDADLKDLYLMSCCRNAIISNSTFSWWAAYLIKNENKMVIAPKVWYRDFKMNKATDNLVPSDWMRL